MDVSVAFLDNSGKLHVRNGIFKKSIGEDIPGNKLKTDIEVGTSTSAQVRVTHQTFADHVSVTVACVHLEQDL